MVLNSRLHYFYIKTSFSKLLELISVHTNNNMKRLQKYIKLYSKTFLEVQKSLVNSWDNSVRNLFTIQFPVLAILCLASVIVPFSSIEKEDY